MAFDTLWLFITVSFLISATPGPVMLAAMVQGAQFGVRKAHWGMLGATVGHLLLMALAGLGIGWLANQQHPGFVVLQWLGAVYLCYLGLKTVAKGRKPRDEVAHCETPQGLARPNYPIFWVSVGVACSNPKGVIYFATILPPFISLEQPLLPQLFLLTVIFALIDYVWMLVYAVGGHLLVNRFRGATFWRWFNRVAGVLFLVIGLMLLQESLGWGVLVSS